MTNAIYSIPRPQNEPVYAYAPGSAEKKLLKDELAKQLKEEIVSRWLPSGSD